MTAIPLTPAGNTHDPPKTSWQSQQAHKDKQSVSSQRQPPDKLNDAVICGSGHSFERSQQKLAAVNWEGSTVQVPQTPFERTGPEILVKEISSSQLKFLSLSRVNERLQPEAIDEM
ncbi:MAG TPA: hypothetical protein VHC22_32445 [Pirellulales bacterium]|nr:hypothetical protein [Pirellulales bacterium]